MVALIVSVVVVLSMVVVVDGGMIFVVVVGGTMPVDVPANIIFMIIQISEKENLLLFIGSSSLADLIIKTNATASPAAMRRTARRLRQQHHEEKCDAVDLCLKTRRI